MHSPGERLDQRGGRSRRLGRPLQPLHQVAARDELQGEVWATFRLADVVDADDVWMVQASDGLRFLPEAREVARPGVPAGQDHFERDQPVQTLMASLVDD